MGARAANGLRVFGLTDQGRVREANEDRCHVDAANGLLIVVDGVGGHLAGGTAADICLATLRQRLDGRIGLTGGDVRAAIIAANNAIHAQAARRAEWRGMACVMTVAVVRDGTAIIGHVGDTRLYKIRAGRIVKVTHDHSPVGEMEDARRLTEAEAMHHPRRNEVYRDVGSNPHNEDAADLVELLEIPVEPDAALLLCSDGLTDLVPLQAIADAVSAHAGQAPAVVRTLIEAANAAGGKDNITVVYAEGPRFTAGRIAPVAGLLDSLRLDRRRGVDHADTSDSDQEDIVTSRLSMGPAAPAAPAAPVWMPVIVGLLLVTLATVHVQFEQVPAPNPVDPIAAVSGADAAAQPQVVVQPGDSIMAALQRARPGSTVIVEPGEYREQITLVSQVRLLSRVPRGAVLRLPVTARDGDAAVTAAGVTDAELTGFRIVGDAATPLGIGIAVSESSVTIADVEITGAMSIGIDFGPRSTASLVGSVIRDNPGAALAFRPGAAPRVSHSTFERNGFAGTASGFVLMAGAVPVLTDNVFVGMPAQAFEAMGADALSAITRHNWFVPERRRARP